VQGAELVLHESELSTRLPASLSLALALALLASCSAPGEARPTLRVAAAASLSEVMQELAGAFEREHDVDVELRFGASSTLARQIEEGAPTDVLVSADPRWVQALLDARLATASTRRRIATNRLVAIVPSDSTSVPSDVHALVALPHLALAGPDVPAGTHARTALARLGVLEAAQPRVVESSDVRAALAWVARGEAEGAVVYATDARIEPRVRVAFELPPESHDPIVVEAVAMEGELAARFVSHLASSAAQRTLADAGFGPPP
jgi:molybdate transport system substrate-binding protein